MSDQDYLKEITASTFRDDYRDFYDADDGYHRILFRGGHALQARELIELQTIIQSEIERFGSNIFKEGALVNPGGVTIDNKVEFVKMTESSNVPSLDQLPADRVVENQDGVMAEVLDIVGKIVYVQYINTKSGSSDGGSPRFVTDDRIEILGTVATSGRAVRAAFAEGDYFVQGHFVHTTEKSFMIDPDGSLSEHEAVDIGFRIKEVLVTASEDDSLYDNSGAQPNVGSPGADRYKIILEPTKRTDIASDENFVFIARVLNGVVTREVTSHDGYNRINKLLAQRTKEESGDYVAHDFTAVFEDFDDANLLLDVSEGIAYVDGYRLDMGRTEIVVPKAQTVRQKDREVVSSYYGNWVYVDAEDSNTTGFGDLSSFGMVNIRNDQGQVIGDANTRGIEQDAAGYRLYIFNVKLGDGATFSQAVSFVDKTNENDPFPDVMYLVDTHIYGTINNSLIFPLPQTSPERNSIASAQYTKTVARVNQQPDGTELTLAGVEQQNWVISEVGGGILDKVADNSGKFTGLDSTKTYNVLTYVNEPNGTYRKKTLKRKTDLQITTDHAQLEFATSVETTVVDGYELVQVLQDDGKDVTHMYEMDGGQRDNFYDFVSFRLKTGFSIPDGITLSFDFKHFEHDAGDFFSVTSYLGEDAGDEGLAYEDIPSHTYVDGTTVSLRDVIDFRPSRNTDGSFPTLSIPQNASGINLINVKYYEPRIDILVANSKDRYGDVGVGELQVIQGQSSANPRPPEVPTGSLPLYIFRLNPYTFNSSDVVMEKQTHKRFTMKDIAAIETRVDDLYELTTLSLLESNTQSLTVLDDQGSARTKAGFIADNFTSFSFSDVNNPDYRASIETVSGLMKPSFRENLVRLKHDASQGNSTRTGDYVTLPYTHASFITQDVATGSMNINPFAVITQEGHTTLSPSSDQWVETQTLPPIMQTTVRRSVPIDLGFEDLWWNGITNTNRPRTRQQFSVESTSRAIQEFVGERVVDTEVVPFMRSRKVSFKAEGLRPNTNVFAYFGNRNVSQWCKPANSFVEYSTTDSEVGSEFASATQHPQGTGQLVTNEKGEVFGEFFLPNTNDFRFRTGTQDFVILDANIDTTTSRLTSQQQNDAMSSSSAPYTSTGTIESIQRTVRTTRVPQRIRGRRDPLAQSFYVDPSENPNGIFLTKVRVYVQSKDDTIPMQVQIRPVENGIPTTTIVPGSVKFVKPADITVAPSNDIASIRSAPTEVEFDEPVYLTAGEEYAIVLLAESVDYNVFVAQTYEEILGGTEGKVSKQPSLGSLFMSQSGSTWTPDQTKDLMFELERADFQTTGFVYLENAVLPSVSLSSNPFTAINSGGGIQVSQEGHGFSKGDTVTISGSTGVDVDGQHTIDSVTAFGYTFTAIGLDTNPVEGTSFGGSSAVASQNVVFDEFTPQVSNITPNGTSIVSSIERSAAKSYGAADGRNDSRHSYQKRGDQLTEDAFLNQLNVVDFPSAIATADNNVDTSNQPESSVELKLHLETNDTKVSPIIDLQRTSILALENVIGSGEEAQHITTPITIDESSAGLKVLLGANRPSDASIEVYVKTSATDEGLSSAQWTEVLVDSTVPSDENASVFREYEYSLEAADPFTAFQVKVVMKSTNSSKVPTVRDLRVIALAV